MLLLLDSAAPHASEQNPLLAHIAPFSAQSRAVTKPVPSTEQTIETVPSQRRSPARQATQPPPATSQAAGQTISFVRDIPSGPH
ncbi:MAG: hypothetical protein AAGE52_13935 [Myxococcota bacterium]